MYASQATPIPPSVCIEPVVPLVELVVLSTVMAPPMYASQATPIPPAVVIAPVEVLVEFVVSVALRIPAAFVLTKIQFHFCVAEPKL